MALSEAAQARRRKRARDYFREYRYGITTEQFQARLDKQGHVCAICGGRTPNRELDVDHDHKTGAIRGLLCHYCNTGIAKFRDDPALLQRAAAYLKGA